MMITSSPRLVRPPPPFLSLSLYLPSNVFLRVLPVPFRSLSLYRDIPATFFPLSHFFSLFFHRQLFTARPSHSNYSEAITLRIVPTATLLTRLLVCLPDSLEMRFLSIERLGVYIYIYTYVRMCIYVYRERYMARKTR